MKKYLALGITLSLCFACAQNFQQQIVTNPQPIEQVFTPMLETLKETGYDIKTFNRTKKGLSQPKIIAEKQFLDEGYTLKLNVSFLRINQITHSEIRVHWVGKKKSNEILMNEAAKELSEIFNKKISK